MEFVASHGAQKPCENAPIGRLSAVQVGSLYVQGCKSVGKPVSRGVQFKLPLSSFTGVLHRDFKYFNCLKYINVYTVITSNSEIGRRLYSNT